MFTDTTLSQARIYMTPPPTIALTPMDKAYFDANQDKGAEAPASSDPAAESGAAIDFDARTDANTNTDAGADAGDEKDGPVRYGFAAVSRFGQLQHLDVSHTGLTSWRQALRFAWLPSLEQLVLTDNQVCDWCVTGV